MTIHNLLQGSHESSIISTRCCPLCGRKRSLHVFVRIYWRMNYLKGESEALKNFLNYSHWLLLWLEAQRITS